MDKLMAVTQSTVCIFSGSRIQILKKAQNFAFEKGQFEDVEQFSILNIYD